MMVLEFFIIGGYITIPKDIFVKEMLNKDSVIRPLMKWKNTSDFKGRHPIINENTEDGTITIDFTLGDKVSIGEDPKELLGKLKSRYREKVRGRVVCNISYEMMSGLYTVKFDLNSDTEQIEYV
jgi:hypothetical protein